MSQKLLLRGSYFLISFCLFQFIACATNPVTGKRELILLSESQEIQLGKEADPSIVAQYGIYDDPKIAKFVDEMGQKMAKVSHRPQLKFTFRIVDSPIINAFALPGGYVYFTRGILGYMNSEVAALSTVLKRFEPPEEPSEPFEEPSEEPSESSPGAPGLGQARSDLEPSPV